jgi:hypothetical protein
MGQRRGRLAVERTDESAIIEAAEVPEPTSNVLY